MPDRNPELQRNVKRLIWLTVGLYIIVALLTGAGFFFLHRENARTNRTAVKNTALIKSVCAATLAIGDLDRFFLALARVPQPKETPHQRRIRLAFIRVITHDLATVADTEHACGLGPLPKKEATA